MDKPTTTQRDDGGPAFPTLDGTYKGQVFPTGLYGMSLRDWFAGQALAGHLASLAPGSWGKDSGLARDAAEGAYLVADAMLAERSK